MGCHLCRDDWTLVNGEAGFALSPRGWVPSWEGLSFQATLREHGQRRTPPQNHLFKGP